jgi:hypothetical protein
MVVIDTGEADAGSFREDLAPVHVPSRGSEASFTRYIDLKGKTVFTVDGYGKEFHEGLAVFRGHTALHGYIDRQGKVVIPAAFDEAYDFHEGLAQVRTGYTTRVPGKGDTWGYIDKSGKYRIEAQFNETNQFNGGVAKVHVGGKIAHPSHVPPMWDGGDYWLIDMNGRNLKKSY